MDSTSYNWVHTTWRSGLVQHMPATWNIFRFISLMMLINWLAPLSICAQTVELQYESTSTSSDTVLREYFAYDYESGAAIRIDAVGNIYTITPDGQGYSGRAGVAYLKESPALNLRRAKRFASKVIPQLIVSDIESDDHASLVTDNGELGGPVYTGEYPLGERLMTKHDFPDGSPITYSRAFYDFDTQGRLARVRYEQTGREQTFDIAPSSTPDIPYLQTFGDGTWTLVGARIHGRSRPNIFDPDRVAEIARDHTFTLPVVHREAQPNNSPANDQKHAAESRRTNPFDKGVMESTKSLALIITGLIVICVGSLAWWKNRS